MAHRSLHLNSFFPLVALLLLLLLLHSLFVTSSRPLHGIHPHNPHAITPPAPVSLETSFSINRYKYVETDAFRPTSPGHSPGVGHNEPPGKP
uniref:Uncharacterized protein n=1 Tax=Cucumis sativus TaxID=3659 RepID=A0A0A0KWX0_CUCSA